ncbi:MAG: hypothetical protein ACLFP1_09655 [Candidatus Goldiibacteriota bacterium]
MRMVFYGKKIFVLVLIMSISRLTAAMDNPFYCESARSAGMGGAYTPAPDDASALFYNPAGLMYIEQKSISVFGRVFNYDFETDSGRENYFNSNIGGSAVFPGWGAGFVYVNYGDRLTSVPGNDFMEEALIIAGGFAQGSGNLNIGAGVRLILFSDAAEGVCFTLSGIYEINKYLRGAVVLENIINSGYASVIDDYSSVYPTLHPVTVNISLASAPYKNITMVTGAKIPLGGGYIYTENADNFVKDFYAVSFHTGFEYTIRDTAVLRAGVSGKETYDSGISAEAKRKMRCSAAAGLGFYVDFVKIDAAAVYEFGRSAESSAPVKYYFSTNMIY